MASISPISPSHVLCRCESGLYVRCTCEAICSETLKVGRPTGEILTFQRPIDDATKILDVVVDKDPPVKQLNVGCSVLAAISSRDYDDAHCPTFVLATIIRKCYRPVPMVQVRFDQQESTEWCTRECVRTMVSPWGRRRHGSTSSNLKARRRPKKGDIEVLPHGVLRKFNGSQWRHLCRTQDCLREAQRDGRCSNHLGGGIKNNSRRPKSKPVRQTITASLSSMDSSSTQSSTNDRDRMAAAEGLLELQTPNVEQQRVFTGFGFQGEKPRRPLVLPYQNVQLLPALHSLRSPSRAVHSSEQQQTSTDNCLLPTLPWPPPTSHPSSPCLGWDSRFTCFHHGSFLPVNLFSPPTSPSWPFM